MKTALCELAIALLIASTSFANDNARPRGQPKNAWRYEFYNGRWWYWTPNDRWAFYNGRRWVTLSAQPPMPFFSQTDRAAGGASIGAYPNLGNDEYSKALSAESRSISSGFNTNRSSVDVPGPLRSEAGAKTINPAESSIGGATTNPLATPARSGDAGSGVGGGSVGGTSVPGSAERFGR